MRVSRVEARGLEIHAVHLAEGDGRPAVVLVHGMVVAGRGMLPLARALAEREMAVHVPDVPGFGRSDAVRHSLDVEASAQVLAAWMRRAGLAGASVLGNSYGTQVAAAAVCAGAPAGRLVLLSPTIDARWRGGWTRWLPAGRPGVPEGRRRGALAKVVHDLLVPESEDACVDNPLPSLRSLVLREYAAAGPARVLGTYRHALRDDLAARMPSITVPVLVARASRDGVVSPEWARQLSEAAPQGGFVEIPGADHDGQYLAADAVADALSGFLGVDATQPISTP